MFYDFMLRDVFNSFVYGKPETGYNSARPIRIRTRQSCFQHRFCLVRGHLFGNKYFARCFCVLMNS